MNISQVKTVVKLMLKHEVKTPLILVGERGAGKTQTILDIGKEENVPVSVLRIGSKNDIGDLLGFPELHKLADGTSVTKYGTPSWLVPFLKERKGILFLDEINRAKPSLLDAVMQLLERKFDVWELPDGVIIVAACNPVQTDSKTTYDVNDVDSAFIDRGVWVKVATQHEDVLQYLIAHSFGQEVIDLAALAQVSVSSADFTIVQKDLTPRALRHLNDFLPVIKELSEEAGDELVLGCVGPEGLNHWKNAESLKDLDPEKFFKEGKLPSDLKGYRMYLFVSRCIKWLQNQKNPTQYRTAFTKLLAKDTRIAAFSIRLAREQKSLKDLIDAADEDFIKAAKEALDLFMQVK